MIFELLTFISWTLEKNENYPDATQFYQTAGTSSGYDGYYDVSADALESNFASAVETLKKYYTCDEAGGKFTDFPTLACLYNTSEGHKDLKMYNLDLTGLGYKYFMYCTING